MNTSLFSGRKFLRFVSVLILFAIGLTVANVNRADPLHLTACSDPALTPEMVAERRGLGEETVEALILQAGRTLEEICVMPREQLLMWADRSDEPRPDQPDKAAEFRMLQLQDENGFIPADGYANAKAHIEAMSAVPQPQGSAAGITSASWTWIGPGNIGGRVRSIVINPSDPNIMYAGSVTGGIWKTTDGGTTWQIMDDFMANMAVSTMVMDPTDSNILYAGSGEAIAGWRGAGVFKTTNGGITWTQLASTANSNWYGVNRLKISPTDHLTLLAATESGIWKSTDGGATWTQKDSARLYYDIDIMPDGTHAIASSYWGIAVYSSDGGETWSTATFTGIAPGAGRVEIAYALSSPSTVYASMDITSGQSNGELWKSTDYGHTYSLVNTGNNLLGGQGWYDNIVWVDPTNPDNVMVGGVEIYRSTDGGPTMTKISQWWSAPDLSAHADNHMIVEHPGFNGTTNKIVFFGNDGGIYKTDDFSTVALTSGWSNLNNNLGITQFYGAAGSPLTGIVVGGTQDNGTLLYTQDTGSEGWATVFGGDGGFSAVDPADPNYTYGEYIYGRINRSTTGSGMEYIWGKYHDGTTWTYKSAPYIITEAQSAAGNFIAPFILDPNDSNRLYLGMESLWRSNDIKTPGSAWSATGPSWYVVKAAASGNPISAIAVLEGNADVVWVGHNNGDVYKTTNGTSATPTWVKMDEGAPLLPNRYVTRITLDKTDTNKVYVTFGGFSADNVWMTTDNGSTWADRTGSGLTGLPDVPVRSLVIHPDYPAWIYVGTEVGVFASEDGGATWKLPHDGPTNTSVDELFWMNYTLISATHGRGLFKIAVQSPNTTLQPEMGVKGNNVNILDGDNTPSSSDHTNFGNADVSGAGVDRTFTIRNTGDTFLNLSGTPRVNVSGAHASEFTVTVDPSASVDPNATSNFTVHFAPQGVGIRTATISITNNDPNENPYNFDVQGFGTGTPSGWTWTLCATEGQTCSLTGTQAVRYGANSTYYYGQFTNSVTCNTSSFGGDPVPNVAKSCYVAEPGTISLSVSPTAWDFGSVALGSSSAAKTFTVTNTGTANLILGTLSISGNYTLSSNTCNTPVAPAGTCTFNVTFTPTGTGARNGSVSIPSNASTSPDSASLTGTGTAPSNWVWTLCASENQTCSFSGSRVVRYGANGTFFYGVFTDGLTCNNATFGGDPVPSVAKSCYLGEAGTPALSVSPTSWDFGSVALGSSSAAKTFTVTNTGTGNLLVGTLSISGNYALSNNTCNAPVAPSGTCTFNVIFTPTGTGARNGSVTIPSNAATTPDSASLSGTGAAPSNWAWTQCAGEGGTCSFTGNRVVRYGANGTFFYGVFTNSVACNTTSFGGDPVPNVLKSCYLGAPGSPAVGISPATWSFGSIALGSSSAAKTFTVTNTGTAPLNITTLSITGNYALSSNTCNSATVAPSSTCTFNVTFTPTGTGARNGSVSIPSNAASSPNSVSLTGTGTAPANWAWTLCAGEGGNCTFSGSRVVRYGANNIFYYGVFTGSVACNTTSFGGDPVPNVLKSCYLGAPDTTAPDTAIGATKPTNPTLLKTASFSFSGTDGGSGVASYQCKLDLGAYTACTNPAAYSNLALGTHTFYVRAIDKAGNVDATPATYAWLVWGERAINGGFNTYSGTSKIPTNWVKSTNFSASDGKDTTVKKEGTASVKIIGQSGKTKTLTQTLNLSGASGSKLQFSYWVKGASVPAAGSCMAQVMFYNGPTLLTSQTKTVNCGTVTSAFQQKTLTFNTTAAFTSVKIVFTYSKASGTVWFDLASLLK
ncbi:MAG: choice-of-anchor D domain-containing protein [Chloroflexi bacterium]|nr:choice-of-anchor D domain-containing protein [Chloroflexota bacterium]